MTGDSQSQQLDEDRRQTVDAYLAGAAISILLVATVVYHYIEGWSWVDSFYFSAVAVSTVGFGDITPDTDAAKLFTVFYVFVGIAIISTWLSERMRKHGLRIAHRRQGNGHPTDTD